jgi:hypothetical protein
MTKTCKTCFWNKFDNQATSSLRSMICCVDPPTPVVDKHGNIRDVYPSPPAFRRCSRWEKEITNE